MSIFGKIIVAIGFGISMLVLLIVSMPAKDIKQNTNPLNIQPIVKASATAAEKEAVYKFILGHEDFFMIDAGVTVCSYLINPNARNEYVNKILSMNADVISKLSNDEIKDVVSSAVKYFANEAIYSETQLGSKTPSSEKIKQWCGKVKTMRKSYNLIPAGEEENEVRLAAQAKEEAFLKTPEGKRQASMEEKRRNEELRKATYEAKIIAERNAKVERETAARAEREERARIKKEEQEEAKEDRRQALLEKVFNQNNVIIACQMQVFVMDYYEALQKSDTQKMKNLINSNKCYLPASFKILEFIRNKVFAKDGRIDIVRVIYTDKVSTDTMLYALGYN